MAEAENRRAVERVFRALSENDLELFHEQFHEDSVIEFPQSGERIVGGENRRAVYSAFPGRPTVKRVLVGGNLVVAEVSVDYGDATDWRAVFIYELSEGKISRATLTGLNPLRPPTHEHPGRTDGGLRLAYTRLLYEPYGLIAPLTLALLQTPPPSETATAQAESKPIAPELQRHCYR